MTPVCGWCGQNHPVEQLCAANTVRVTRRRFFGLFTAGVVGLMVAPSIGGLSLEPEGFAATQLLIERGLYRIPPMHYVDLDQISMILKNIYEPILCEQFKNLTDEKVNELMDVPRFRGNAVKAI